MTSSCILLNGDYSYLGIVDMKRAMKLIFAQKVKVLKYSDRAVRTVGKAFQIPMILVLIKVVRVIYRGRVPFKKKNVLIRDEYTCAYCGLKTKKLTLDHILPRSRGGKDDFDNCVASCKACNNRKGPRTPSEAGMHLSRRPYQPTISEFLRMKLKHSGVYDTLVEFGIF